MLRNAEFGDDAAGAGLDAGSDTAAARRSRAPTPEEVGRAAALCFLDREPDEAIARRLGVARRTLAWWKQRPEYTAAWAALRVFFDAELERQRGERSPALR